MGLFGGFKAKFTKNSTTKVKPQEVVCLKYHIQSEFDVPDSPLTLPNNIKKNEVIKRNSKLRARKPLAQSVIFPDSDTSNTSLSSPVTQKSHSLTNLNGHSSEYDDTDTIRVSTTIEMPGNSKNLAVSDTKYERKTEERNGVVAETVAVVTNNHLVSANNNTKTEKREKTILKSFSAYNGTKEERGYNNLEGDQSTLIFMTQHSSETSDKNVENGEDDFDYNFSTMSNRAFKTTLNQRQDSIEEEEYPDGNFDTDFVSNKPPYHDEDDFKVNVVKHDLNRSYSYSEDERSYQEEPLEFTKMGFSSQAASIFFGQDIEPVQPRPRRIMLKEVDEDDRRSSGADC